MLELISNQPKKNAVEVVDLLVFHKLVVCLIAQNEHIYIDLIIDINKPNIGKVYDKANRTAL